MYQENFIRDVNGKKVAVEIPIEIYEKLIADSEELEDIIEYRKAKLNPSQPIPFEQAFNEIDVDF